MVIQVTLPPLEFTDCLLDSPEFRENLHRHEKELDKTSHQIKRIIKEVKELLGAAASKKRKRGAVRRSALHILSFSCGVFLHASAVRKCTETMLYASLGSGLPLLHTWGIFSLLLFVLLLLLLDQDDDDRSNRRMWLKNFLFV